MDLVCQGSEWKWSWGDRELLLVLVGGVILMNMTMAAAWLAMSKAIDLLVKMSEECRHDRREKKADVAEEEEKEDEEEEEDEEDEEDEEEEEEEEEKGEKEEKKEETKGEEEEDDDVYIGSDEDVGQMIRDAKAELERERKAAMERQAELDTERFLKQQRYAALKQSSDLIANAKQARLDALRPEDHKADAAAYADASAEIDAQFNELPPDEAYPARIPETESERDYLARRHAHYESRYVIMHTTAGTVVMNYLSANNEFGYYSYNTSIPFAVLEQVARKYVVKYRARPLFVDHQLASAADVRQKKAAEDAARIAASLQRAGAGFHNQTDYLGAQPRTPAPPLPDHYTKRRFADKDAEMISIARNMFKRRGSLYDYAEILYHTEQAAHAANGGQPLTWKSFRAMSVAEQRRGVDVEANEWAQEVAAQESDDRKKSGGAPRLPP